MYAFNNYTLNRTLEISSDILMKNVEYKKLTRQSIRLHEAIKKMLPQESKQLIDEYEQDMCMIRSLAQDIMYQQGLKDGLRLS